MTEYLTTDTSWSASLRVAKQINDCMYDDMSAYVWWYIVRFYGPIGDGTYGTLPGQVTKRGYVMSQYAKFVRPGYYRVFATENPQPGVYLTAFKGGTETVIVVVNMNSYSTLQPFILKNESVTSFTPYVTSRTKNCAQVKNVTVSNGGFTAALDPSSVTTLVSN